MVEEIEEYLEETFEFIRFRVKHVKVKTYEIMCEILIKDKGKYKIVRTSFIYIWSSNCTKNMNLSSIRLYVNKAINKMFIRGD